MEEKVNKVKTRLQSLSVRDNELDYSYDDNHLREEI